MDVAKHPAEIAKRMRAARSYAGLSQDDLAAALSVSRSTVARWEDSEDVRNVPAQGRQRQIARECGWPDAFDENGKALPVPPEELLDRLAEIQRDLALLKSAVGNLVAGQALREHARSDPPTQASRSSRRSA